MNPNTVDLIQRLARLEGQIDGATETFRVAMILIGGLLAILISFVGLTYSNMKDDIKAIWAKLNK